MENVNNYQNPYYGEDVKQKNTIGKSQTSLLAKSMLIAGGGFVLIFALSWLFDWVFATYCHADVFNNSAIVFSIILGCLIISMIVSLLWTRILWKGKATGLTILAYSIYIIAMSVSFGFLFAYVSWGSSATIYRNLLPICFAVAGGIFLIVALVARVIGLRGMITFGKIITVTGIIAGIAFFALLITMIVVGITRRGEGAFYWGAETISFLSMALIAMSMFFYIIVDIKMIMGASQFNEYTGVEENAPAIAWYFGFKLLSDIINLLFWVVIWITRLARRS